MDESKLGLINIDLYIRFALICGTFIAGFYCIKFTFLVACKQLYRTLLECCLVHWLHLFLFGYFAILRLAETFYTFQLCVHLLDSLSIGWLVHRSVKLLSGQSKMSEQTNYFVYTCFIRTQYLIILKY